MARVKRGVIARARHKKILKQAKGYYGARSRVYRVAFQAVIKAGQYAYRDRRQRKRQFRQLWIARINAAARQNGISYTKNCGDMPMIPNKSFAGCYPAAKIMNCALPSRS
ncbi:50S ribosomal protein L20 [Salmonella enterica subsp. enterica serovar Heidelberg str. SARA40]|nr:50S ribosomal protein L20 [Salmonella enterica subsp. enterica serovar Heidelberg str. SARA40]